MSRNTASQRSSVSEAVSEERAAGVARRPAGGRGNPLEECMG